MSLSGEDGKSPCRKFLNILAEFIRIRNGQSANTHSGIMLKF